MTLITDFLKSLAMPVGQLASWLEEEHNVPVNDTIGKWNQFSGMNVTTDGNVTEEMVDETISIKNTKNSPIQGLNPLSCQHVFVVGNRKGQQCTTKPKGGSDRCSAHKDKKNKKSDSSSDKQQKIKTKKKVPISPPMSESESNEDEPLPPKKTKKKVPISPPMSESESNEDEPLPPKTYKKSIFDTDDEEEPSKKKSQKKITKKVPDYDTCSDSD